MSDPLDTMALIVRLIAGAILALCLAVIAGYGLHAPAVVSVLPGLQGMSLLTAAGLIGLAASTLAESYRRPRAARVGGFLVLVLGSALLLVDLVAGRDVVSPFLAHRIFLYDAAIAGKTSIATALCLVLLASAALLRDRPGLCDALSAVTLIISSLAILGYAYGVRELYAIPVFATMALHTATATTLLSMASILVRPDVGWAEIIGSKGAGGAATRRQLGFLLAPPVAGVILLHATAAHALGPGAAMAFLVVLTIVPLTLLILRDGRALNTVEREQAEKAVLQATQTDLLNRRLVDQADALRQESAERERAEASLFRSQKMQAVGQLTGGIAHDFNNLLMAIGGNLQLALKRLAPDHPAYRFADNASAAAAKGSKLTSQLLAFSRTQKMNIRPVELDPLLHKAKDLLANALGPSISVQLQLSAMGAWVATDPDQLDLAILNLALNARDAMPDGGCVTLESEQRLLRLTPDQEERWFLTISVRDTGAGMSPEVANQAAEPFFSTKQRGEASGLGLAQVYGFVQQCQGDLRITSQLGEGTTVRLLLPLTTGEGEQPPSKPYLDERPAGGVGAGKLVLVIDDDDNVRAVLVETLRAAGFRVVEASNGDEGLGYLSSHKPAAAVIDFLMPGMNGAEVARRAQLIFPELPIIFVSGYFDTVALDGIRGAIVLRKPFDLEGLNRAVSSALH